MAYPFVRLHQPTQFYGVNSTKMGSDRIETTGGNAGLTELAPVAEVLAYFNTVMQEKLLPSGRLTYLGVHEFDEKDNCALSLITGKKTKIEAGKIVDSAYSKVVVPSMRPPNLSVGKGVTCIPVNGLPKAVSPHVPRYCILGCGKTGIDAITWLLERGLNPDKISWVMPRDAWHIDRRAMQPGGQFLDYMVEVGTKSSAAQVEATSITDLYHRLEKAGEIMRIDESVEPAMNHCGNITRIDCENLRKVKDVIRLGRVTSLGATEVTLEKGKREMPEGTVYVDCTANGLARRPPVPVFQQDKIVIQPVRYCQQVFSAALIAHIEVTLSDDSEKNRLMQPIPHPDTVADAIKSRVLDNRNRANWIKDTALSRWLDKCRLDITSYGIPVIEDEKEYEAMNVGRVKDLEAGADHMEMLLAKEGHKLYDV